MSHYAILLASEGVSEILAHSVSGIHPRIGEVVDIHDDPFVVVGVRHTVAADSCGVTCSKAVVYVQRDRTEEVP